MRRRRWRSSLISKIKTNQICVLLLKNQNSLVDIDVVEEEQLDVVVDKVMDIEAAVSQQNTTKKIFIIIKTTNKNEKKANLLPAKQATHREQSTKPSS